MNQLASNAILFANDNPSFLMYIGILVKRLGYRVYLALDGSEAVKVARERRPTIIVIDHALHDADGTSCLSLIRSDANLRDIPVIVLGPEDETLPMPEIKKMGVQGYLKKPLNVTEFYLAIQHCLNHSTKRRHARAPLVFNASLNCRGEQKNVLASNLSIEGVFLKTGEPYPEGTEMDILLSVNDEEPLALTGRVVDVARSISADINAEPGMGIRFMDVPEEVRNRLHCIVMKELTRDISVSDAGETWLDDTLNSV